MSEKPGVPRIKICGITRVADAVAALELGIDAIGLVFYPASPRAVAIKQAQDIANAVGPFVTVVGLFVDATVADVEAVLETVPLQLLQFHGNESPGFCAHFQRPWMKALRVRSAPQIEQMASEYQHASALLLDTYKPGVPGGTGEIFDWSVVPQALSLPLVLAGGLTAANVEQAIDIVKPYAVDVSGGVESEAGKKDFKKMQAFVQAVKRVRV